MGNDANLTLTSALILKAIEDGCSYGFEIMADTGLASGTIYPALRRLESSGLVESWWDAEDEESGGPPRRHYQLKKKGTLSLDQARMRFPVLAERGQ